MPYAEQPSPITDSHFIAVLLTCYFSEFIFDAASHSYTLLKYSTSYRYTFIIHMMAL